MKFFNNFQTKKQLREENERLKFMLHRPQPINFVEREVQTFSSCMELRDYEIEVPIEIIKKRILHKLADELEPFVEWDIEDGLDKNGYGKIIRGNIYLAKKSEDKDNE